jgi:hypothetical protein
MFLYVTDKIKTYHKIGIAENVHDRLNTFKTLIPDLDLNLYIPLPNRRMGELIERTLKDHLKVFRLNKSECYGLNIDSIRQVITGYTLLMNYCVIDYNINPKDYPYELSQFDKSRIPWEGSGEEAVIFLNDIYFGEKIPLIAIKRVNDNKIKVKVINRLNSLEELAKMCFKLVSVFESHKISLKNPLFEYIKEFDDKEIEVKEFTFSIIEYFSPIIWGALFKYLLYLKEIHSSKNISSIKNIQSEIIKDFPYDCLTLALRNKERGLIDNMYERDKIPGTYAIDVAQLKYEGSLFGRPKL